MAVLLKIRKVSLYKDQPFGINQLSLDIERGRKYHITVDNEEQLHTLAGLIEGRFKKQSGFIEKADRLFIQSDRLLLGDKVYSQTVKEFLFLSNDFFHFGGRRRSKFGFIQTLKAKHLVDYPIYKLREADKIKFTLLALAFQERGITLISKLPAMQVENTQHQFLQRIIDETHTTCCLLTSPNEASHTLSLKVPEAIEITVGGNRSDE
jgi:hypothetical protein